MKILTVKRMAMIVAIMLMIPVASMTMLPATAQTAAPPAPPSVYFSSSNYQLVNIPQGSTFYVMLPSTRQLLGRVGVTPGIQLTYSVNQGSNNFYEFKALTKGTNKYVRILYTPSPGLIQIYHLRINVV